MDYDSDDGPSERRFGAVAEAIDALSLEVLVDTHRSGANGAVAASELIAGALCVTLVLMRCAQLMQACVPQRLRCRNGSCE